MWFLVKSKDRPSFGLCSNSDGDTLNIQKTFFFFLFFLLFLYSTFILILQTLVLRADFQCRSQWVSCSCYEQTPTQKQVIHEWFSTRLPMNMGAWFQRGSGHLSGHALQKLLILEVKFNLLLLLHLNTIVCLRMWWLINFSSYCNHSADR